MTTISEQTIQHPTEGWTWLSNAPKSHYFVNHRSLCGRWAVLVHPSEGYDQGPTVANDCKTCQKKLVAWKKKQQKQEATNA